MLLRLFRVCSRSFLPDMWRGDLCLSILGTGMEKSSVTLHLLHCLLIATGCGVADHQPVIVCRWPCRYMQAYITWVQAGRLLSKQFPSPPSDSLIMGHAPSMQSPRNHRWLSDIHKQLGPLIYIRLAHNHVSRLLPNLLTHCTVNSHSVTLIL